jgi:hypothetical protein
MRSAFWIYRHVRTPIEPLAGAGKRRGGRSRPSNRMSDLEIDGRFSAAFRLHFVADLLAFVEAL